MIRFFIWVWTTSGLVAQPSTPIARILASEKQSRILKAEKQSRILKAEKQSRILKAN